MNQEKYIGMDVHAATISAAVMNTEGKLLIDQPRSPTRPPSAARQVIYADYTSRAKATRFKLGKI